MTRSTKILLVSLLIVVVLAAAAGITFLMEPLAVMYWFERRALVNAGFSEQQVSTPAGTLHYYERGSGPAVVLLHGAGDQAGAWSKVAPALAANYRVLVPDLPGHGKSEPQVGPLEMATMLRGLTGMLEQRAGDRPVTLVGNSMGAWLAMLYSAQHPERVARVVAVNGGAIRGREDISLYPANRREAAALLDQLRDPGAPPVPGFVLDDVVQAAHEGPLARMAASMPELEQHLLDGRLATVTTPVEMLWGEADRMMPLDYARKMGEALPASRLTVVPRCGHVPLRECPIAFGNKLKEVLGSEPPQPRRPAPAAPEKKP